MVGAFGVWGAEPAFLLMAKLSTFRSSSILWKVCDLHSISNGLIDSPRARPRRTPHHRLRSGEISSIRPARLRRLPARGVFRAYDGGTCPRAATRRTAREDRVHFAD